MSDVINTHGPQTEAEFIAEIKRVMHNLDVMSGGKGLDMIEGKAKVVMPDGSIDLIPAVRLPEGYVDIDSYVKAILDGKAIFDGEEAITYDANGLPVFEIGYMGDDPQPGDRPLDRVEQVEGNVISVRFGR